MTCFNPPGCKSATRCLRRAKDDRQLARNLARQLTIYATGSPIHFSDRAQIERILDQAASGGYGIRSLVQALVGSDLFLNK